MEDQVYLYSIWSGQLCMYHGNLYEYKTGKSLLFLSNTKRFECAINPGEAFNGVLWLPEKDVNKAKRLFIRRDMNEIDKLNEKIVRLKHRISTLEKMEQEDVIFMEETTYERC